LITYLCGGINGLSDSQCKDWRKESKSLLNTNTLDPMRRDYRGIEHLNTDKIVEDDIKDIQESDFVLVNAEKPSWGTAMEIVYSYEFAKEIVAFTTGPRISPWLKYHCNAILETLEEAIDYINERANDYTR
jgi:nucleoside 2-deoxyribosyltransferase